MRTSSSLFAAFLLAAATAAPATTLTFIHTNLVEKFSTIGDNSLGARTYITSGGNNVSAEGTFSGDDPSLTWYGKGVCKGPYAIRFGNASNDGWAQTDILDPTNATSTVTVFLSAAAHPTGGYQTLTVSLLDSTNASITGASTTFTLARLASGSTNVDSQTVDENDVPLVATFENVAAPFKVRFDGRDSFLGEVLVVQEWEMVTSQIQLDDPTGIQCEPNVTAVQVSWPPVENAVGYEWEVRDALGGLVQSGSFPQDTTSPTMSTMVYGLRENTGYVFRLQATGDGADILDSGWTETPFQTQPDPWAVLWTVGEFSSQPRVGTEFSFAVSTIRRNGMAVTSVLDRVVPAVSSTPSYAIENGVCIFTWTPGPDEDGDYVARFAVRDRYGNTTDTKEVPIRVRPATEVATLFWEDFPSYSNAWLSTVDIDLPTTDTRVAGWTGEKLYKAKSAMKLGKTSDYGTATTPAIETANGAAATVELTLDAAAYAGKTGTLGITAVDAATSAVLFSSNVVLAVMSSNTVTSLSDYPIGPFSFAAGGTFKITFVPISGDGRMGIDSVKVTQNVSTSQTDLDVPTGLAIVDGTRSTNSFSVAWNAVANATAYTVALNYETGSEPFFTTNLAATTVSLSGLADDTSYEVRVRAEGDTALYNFSDWTNVIVRTLRSVLHPTLSVGAWENAANAPGEHTLYGVIGNEATVSAELDDHTPVEVALARVRPAPSSAPTLANGTLSWMPAAADEGTTFELTFEMTPAPGVVYATNLSFKVQSLPELHVPDVTVAEPVLWNAIDLSWDQQYRAAGYGVRAWTDCPNPGATATHMEEYFSGYYKKGGGGNRAPGWVFRTSGVGYNNATAPVQFSKDGNWMATYDLGGPISSVTFFVKGNSMANGSTLRVFWAGALSDAEMEDKDNWTNHLVHAVSDLGSLGQTVTAQVPAGANARRLVWQYEQHDGNIGVGQVVIEGAGFSTPRFLPGWGPVAKDVGLVNGCTVAHPRPGIVLGVNPANKKEDLAEDRINYAEVTVRDADGATLATVVEVAVPAPPRSARATLMILQ